MRTLRLASAAEIVAALGADEPVVRLKVVRAVRDRPDLVAAFGVEATHAVIEALWRGAGVETDSAIRAAVLEALQALPAPQLTPRCIEALSVPDHALAVVAARILNGRETTDLVPAMRLRIWLLAENAQAIERSLQPEYASAWLAELAGPHGPLARRVLEAFGARVIAMLDGCNLASDTATHAWLVGLIDAESLPSHLDMLRRALACDAHEVLVAAVGVCAANIDRLPAAIRARAEQLGEHAHPDVRIAACSLPLRSFDAWRARYHRESDVRVRAAMLRACGSAESLNVLVSAMQSASWRERAAAADALVAIGAPAIAPLRALLERGSHECRAGARHALARLGDASFVAGAAVNE